MDRTQLYENAKTSSLCRRRRNLTRQTYRYYRRILIERADNKIAPSTDAWRAGRARHKRDTDSQAEEDGFDCNDSEEEEGADENDIDTDTDTDSDSE